jgi:hypothetical protein
MNFTKNDFFVIYCFQKMEPLKWAYKSLDFNQKLYYNNQLLLSNIKFRHRLISIKKLYYL